MSHVRQQVWDPQRYVERAAFVQDGGAPVLDLLAARAGERILDLGCGVGGLSRRIAETGARVLGLDASAEMIASAREQQPDLEFVHGDAEAIGFDAEFDAVFSNAALHWMLRPDAVAQGVYRALKPGGRFAAEFGGVGNVLGVREAVSSARRELQLDSDSAPTMPWYFPSIGEYSALLERAGFEVRFAALIERPSAMNDAPNASGVRAWLELLAQPLIADVPEPQRSAFFEAVERHARPQLFRDGAWWIDYVRIRVVALRRA